MNLELTRLISGVKGVKGVLTYDKQIICNTLELPWQYNIRSMSCIPAGEYEVVKTTSPKFGEVFYLKHVPNRQGILIHAGNTLKDTRGCILVGLFSQFDMVVESRNAMKKLYSVLPAQFKLIIKEAY